MEFSDGSKIDNASEITKRGFSGYYFSLSDDIKLEGGNWIPIVQAALPEVPTGAFPTPMPPEV